MTDALQQADDRAAAVAVAPRVTLEQIKNRIRSTEFAVFGGTLTVCVLTMANGFQVTGESACASPENFNRDLGEEIARKNAVEKVWMLEGYLLRETLAQAKRHPGQPVPQEAFDEIQPKS